MKTVYNQDDAPDLKRTGQAHRASALIYVTPIANGADVEIEGAGSTVGETVAVATDGENVWPLNDKMLSELQRAKRPAAKNPTTKAGAKAGGGQIKGKTLQSKV